MNDDIKKELELDSDGDVLLPGITSEQECMVLKTETEEHVADPLSLDVGVTDDVKCKYESDPEYDDGLRKVTLEQRHGEFTHSLSPDVTVPNTVKCRSGPEYNNELGQVTLEMQRGTFTHPLPPDVAVTHIVKCGSGLEYNKELRNITLEQQQGRFTHPLSPDVTVPGNNELRNATLEQQHGPFTLPLSPDVEVSNSVKSGQECNKKVWKLTVKQQRGHPVSSDMPVPNSVKSVSGPEHNKEIRKLTLEERDGVFTLKESQEQEPTPGGTLMDSGASAPITPRKPFACNICGEGFTKILTLSKHLRDHKQVIKTADINLRLKAGEIFKKFKTPTSVNKKGNKPTGAQKQGFSKKVGGTFLIEHSEVRLPYRCPQCRIGFSGLIELSKHVRKAKVHTRSFEIYECSICGLSFGSFSSIAQIKNHIGEHVGFRPLDVTILEDPDD